MKNVTTMKWILASSLFFGILNVNAEQQFSSANQNASMFQGSFQTVIKLNEDSMYSLQKSGTLTAEDIMGVKIVSIMRLVETPEVRERIAALDKMEITENDYSNGIEPFHTSSTAKDLTMRGVPVLDQGSYGTCVTFSATGLLDALIEKGDFVDQQCSLAHNLFLGNNYWDGAWTSLQIIEPLQKYGIVEKNKCTKKYAAPAHKISTDDYKKLVNTDVNIDNVKFKYHEPFSLDEVRTAVNAGRLVSIGFWLRGDKVQGFDITINGKKRTGGLWACTQPASKTNYCKNPSGGHAVIVTGIDDGQRLFKIRNSWGPNTADDGDFYMTYEYFEAFGVNGTEFWTE